MVMGFPGTGVLLELGLDWDSTRSVTRPGGELQDLQEFSQALGRIGLQPQATVALGVMRERVLLRVDIDMQGAPPGHQIDNGLG